MTFNLSNKDNHLWNDMITVLNANFAQASATHIECLCKWTVKLSQKQIRASAKQSGIRWCEQTNKAVAIDRIERDLLKGYKLRTNYVKNATSVSSCNLEQVTPTKYPNQNTYKINNTKHYISVQEDFTWQEILQTSVHLFKVRWKNHLVNYFPLMYRYEINTNILHLTFFVQNFDHFVKNVNH